MGLFYDKFILFGDSITQFSSSQALGFGFQPALQNAYIRKLEIINRGFSGYNTDHAVVILSEVLEAEIIPNKSDIKLMTIFFGTNDALNTMQYVPLTRYKDNLKKITKLALDKGIKPIIIGPTLHDPALAKIGFDQKGKPIEEDVTSNKQNKLYSEAAESIANELKVPFVDLWNAFKDFGGWTEEQLLAGHVSLENLLVDGIHFAPNGYKILYEKVMKAINKFYPELSPDIIPEKLVHWSEIDLNNLKGTIFKSGDLKP